MYLNFKQHKNPKSVKEVKWVLTNISPQNVMPEKVVVLKPNLQECTLVQ